MNGNSYRDAVHRHDDNVVSHHLRTSQTGNVADCFLLWTWNLYNCFLKYFFNCPRSQNSHALILF